MPSKKRHVDPIPEKFSSYEEAAEFWDVHDTTDYPEAFKTVKVKAELRKRHFEVEIDAELIPALRKRASTRRISVRRLVNDMLRRQISHAAERR
jgi:predicted DNA binding CopG/RHH family protein